MVSLTNLCLFWFTAENRNRNNSPPPPSDTTYSGRSSHASLIEEAVPSPSDAPNRASSLEGSLAAALEIFGKGSRTTLKSGGSASYSNGTKNLSHIEGIGSYVHQAFRHKKICDIGLMMPVHKVVLHRAPSLRRFLRQRNFHPTLSPQRFSGCGMWTLLPWKSLLISCIQETSKLSETFKVEQLSKHCIDGLKSLSHAELLKLLPIMRRTRTSQCAKPSCNLLGKQFMASRKSHEFLSFCSGYH